MFSEIAKTEVMPPPWNSRWNNDTPRPILTAPEGSDVDPVPPDVIRYGKHTLHKEHVIGHGGEATVWLYVSRTKPTVHAAVKCSHVPSSEILQHQLHIMRRIESTCGGIRGQIGRLSMLEPDGNTDALLQEHMLVMPYINGVTLESVMQNDGKLSQESCAKLGMQLCSRINDLHSAGFFHGDVKPSNIIITVPPYDGADDDTSGSMSIELIDFTHAADMNDIRHGHIPGGTPSYLSPEQWDVLLHHDALVGRPTDVYATGHTLYSAATGTTLLPENPEETANDLYLKHMQCIEGKYDDRLDLLPASLRYVLHGIFRPAAERPTIREIMERLRGACLSLNIDPEEPIVRHGISGTKRNISIEHISELLRESGRSVLPKPTLAAV